MCTAIEEIKKDCEKDGMKRGEELGLRRGEELGLRRGEERLSELIDILIKENRIEDIKKVTQDSEYRQTLYLRYRIE